VGVDPREPDFCTELDEVVGQVIEGAVAVDAGEVLECVVPSGSEGLVDPFVLHGVSAGGLCDAQVFADVVDFGQTSSALALEDLPPVVSVIEREERVEVGATGQSFGVGERGNKAEPATDVVTEWVREGGCVIRGADRWGPGYEALRLQVLAGAFAVVGW